MRPKVQGLNCRAYAADPRPWMHAYGAKVDFSIQDMQSRLYGYSGPSRIVLSIRALGIAEANAAGVYCADGGVLRKGGVSRPYRSSVHPFTLACPTLSVRCVMHSTFLAKVGDKEG